MARFQSLQLYPLAHPTHVSNEVPPMGGPQLKQRGMGGWLPSPSAPWTKHVPTAHGPASKGRNEEGRKGSATAMWGSRG